MIKESANDHRIISVLSNHRMTSHRSVSGPLNSLQMATTGNWNSVLQHKQKGPLCDGHKCGRVKTCGIWNHYICLLWQLWPLIIPILTSTFLEVTHQLAVCLFDPFPDWLREVHFYWWLKVTARPRCALAVPALIPTWLPINYIRPSIVYTACSVQSSQDTNRVKLPVSLTWYEMSNLIYCVNLSGSQNKHLFILDCAVLVLLNISSRYSGKYIRECVKREQCKKKSVCKCITKWRQLTWLFFSLINLLNYFQEMSWLN